MKLKYTLLTLFILSSLLMSPVHIARADTGPKPTMDFAFKNLAESDLQIVSGILYECELSDCSDAEPLQEGGPQRFTCDTTACHALAYGFAPYHKIEIEFSDEQTRQSNIFQTAGFNSQYTVTVRPDDLLVEAEFSLGVFPPFVMIAILCCCALVGIALVVGLIIFLIRRSKKT